jgi:hypothetical protein
VTVANYVLVYKGGGGMPATDEERQAAMAAWGAWFGDLGEALVDAGNPFGPSASIAADGSVGDSGPSGLTGYSVLSADSLAEATERAKGCPMLAGGGGNVEVYEAIPIPM